MINNNDPAADEVIATAERLTAIARDLREQRDELLEALDETENALARGQEELAAVRRELDELKADTVAAFAMTLPGGRPWSFFEEGKVLAISPDIDDETRARLLAQVERPRLTTCRECGAPVYAGRDCTMHD